MPTPPFEFSPDTLADGLARQGWCLLASALDNDFVAALAGECRARAAAGVLSQAGIGRGDALRVREGIRGDSIDWLEPGQAEVSDRYLALMDELRLVLNRELFLGLEDFEAHFALYPPGAFYRKHVDRFRDDDRRTVSAVLYLNPDWQPEQGGQLRLYFADGSIRDVEPEAGTLVVFLSGDLPHEVLPANRERLSLTGWFRRRGDTPL